MVAPPVAVVGPVGLERVLRARHKRMLAPYLNDWLRWAGITHVEQITHRPTSPSTIPNPDGRPPTQPPATRPRR